MNEYEVLKNYWNDSFSNMKITKVANKWITNEVFNNKIKEFVPLDGTILDYGCGSGWALLEIAYTIPIKKGIGIDPSINGVTYAKKMLENNNNEQTKKLSFVCGDEKLLDNYQKTFDFIISVNTIDVLPDEIVEKILEKIKKALKNKGVVMFCVNPLFSSDFLINKLGMEKNGNCFYKNSILRLNFKSDEEWIKLLSKYFKFIETNNFILTEGENKCPRRMFVLKND